MFLALYTGFSVPVALVVSATVAKATSEVIPVFFAVLAVLCTAGAVAGGLLLDVFTGAWDAQWDQDGRSWAILEAEQIVQQAGEKR